MPETTDERIIQALNAYPELSLVILFGSMARGTETQDSDLDLAVQADRPLSVKPKMAMTESLALEFNRPVDLIDLRTVGQPLLSEIVAEGRRIRGQNEDWAQLIFKNIMDNEDFVPIQKRILRERRAAWLNS
jgi:predicted nucleotidyltransferase